jgi:hypothetical protein
VRLSHREKKKNFPNLDRLSHYIINIRNRDVSSHLQSLYNSDLREGNLKTFCISNTIYWQERDKPTQKALPFLNLSGIIELRRYCIGIVAESHLKETINYMKNEIPTLLNSVQIWIDASLGDANAERKQEILNTVSAIQRELDEVRSLRNSMRNNICLLCLVVCFSCLSNQ